MSEQELMEVATDILKQVNIILYRYIMFGRGICKKYQSRDEKFPESNGERNLVSRLVFFANTNYMLFDIITPYIRMLSSDWLMKGVFFSTILSFFSFSAIAGVFA
jgi:hypothetical protein